MILVQAILAVVASATFVAAQSDSEVVGLFILGRHGDRTPKTQAIGIEGSAVLTTLGKNQVFESGTYFQNYYLNPSGPNFIQGVNSNYQVNQIYASAPYIRCPCFCLMEVWTMCSSLLPRGSGRESSLLRILPLYKLLRMARRNPRHSTDINMLRSTLCRRLIPASFRLLAIKRVLP